MTTRRPACTSYWRPSRPSGNPSPNLRSDHTRTSLNLCSALQFIPHCTSVRLCAERHRGSQAAPTQDSVWQPSPQEGSSKPVLSICTSPSLWSMALYERTADEGLSSLADSGCCCRPPTPGRCCRLSVRCPCCLDLGVGTCLRRCSTSWMMALL